MSVARNSVKAVVWISVDVLNFWLEIEHQLDTFCAVYNYSYFAENAQKMNVHDYDAQLMLASILVYKACL